MGESRRRHRHGVAADQTLKAPPSPLALGALAAVVATKLALHLYASGVAAYGYQADELYYLACARRPPETGAGGGA